jgi:hypothetical protein
VRLRSCIRNINMWASALPRVIWLRTSPLGCGGLWCCHMSYGSGPRLPIEVGSGATTCPTALDHASPLGGLWVPIRTSFKSRQVAERASTHCHVPYYSRSSFPAEVGSGAATCPTTPDLTTLPRWALVLPCVLWLQTSPID